MKLPQIILGNIRPLGDATLAPIRAVLIDNPDRQKRFPKALEEASCPFCKYKRGFPELIVDSYCEHGWEWVVAENIRPILRGQLIHIPQGSHVVGLCDVGLTRYLIDLVRKRKSAVYMSPTPGAGRSKTHLHINEIPAEAIKEFSLPEFAPSAMRLQLKSATILEVVCDDFSAIRIEGNDDAVAEALATLHVFHNEVEMRPYNLLAWMKDSGELFIVIVPRANENSMNAGQAIAGFELLTGYLIPADERFGVIDLDMRHAAFAEVTLQEHHFDDYLRNLDRFAHSFDSFQG